MMYDHTLVCSSHIPEYVYTNIHGRMCDLVISITNVLHHTWTLRHLPMTIAAVPISTLCTSHLQYRTQTCIHDHVNNSYNFPINNTELHIQKTTQYVKSQHTHRHMYIDISSDDKCTFIILISFFYFWTHSTLHSLFHNMIS